MPRAFRSTVVLALACSLGVLSAAGRAAADPREPPPSEASAGWKARFEELCAKTQDAMVLGDDELRSLVDGCDRLVPIIEGLGESERKVYSRRLRACRDLYAYVLASRKGNP